MSGGTSPAVAPRYLSQRIVVIRGLMSGWGCDLRQGHLKWEGLQIPRGQSSPVAGRVAPPLVSPPPPPTPPPPPLDPESSGPCCGCWRAPTALIGGKWRMKFAEPETSCNPPGGKLLMKCSSLHSRQWLRVRGELQGLIWLWPVPVGTQSHTSRSLERWPSCSITPSGRVTLPK
jgi:hypothetical protein